MATLHPRTISLALLFSLACQSVEPDIGHDGFTPATFEKNGGGTRVPSAPREPGRVPRSDPAGFYTEERDGRLWVFRTDDMALLRFLETGEPATSVTLVGAGPGGTSLRGTERDTLLLYLAQRPGYHVELMDDRLWVLEEGSDELEAFRAKGPPEKCVTLVGAGPLGKTLRGPDRGTLVEYLGQVPGYHVELVDGRLWVFEEGSPAHAEFLDGRKPEKNATKVGVGPLGTSLRGAELRVLREYLYAKPGFHVALGTVGDREFLWVFRTGSDALGEFLASGEPAKSVTRIGAGPDGLTLRGPDRAVLDAYGRAR